MTDLNDEYRSRALSGRESAQYIGLASVNLLEEASDSDFPLSMKDLKQIVMKMGDDDFLIQLSLTEEEDESCL